MSVRLQRMIGLAGAPAADCRRRTGRRAVPSLFALGQRRHRARDVAAARRPHSSAGVATPHAARRVRGRRARRLCSVCSQTEPLAAGRRGTAACALQRRGARAAGKGAARGVRRRGDRRAARGLALHGRRSAASAFASASRIRRRGCCCSATASRSRREHIARASGEVLSSSSASASSRRSRNGGRERARIARELHDVVAHSLTVMIVQADGAAAYFERRPTRRRQRCTASPQRARTALGEMRRLLGVLREDTDGIAATPALQPQPGIDQLDALLAQVGSAGLPTRLIRTGAPTPLNPGVAAHGLPHRAGGADKHPQARPLSVVSRGADWTGPGCAHARSRR